MSGYTPYFYGGEEKPRERKRGKMIQVKKLKRPTKRSGRPLRPGQVHQVDGGKLKLVNTSKDQTYYVDRLTVKK